MCQVSFIIQVIVFLNLSTYMFIIIYMHIWVKRASF
jgi:hypothetical protein